MILLAITLAPWSAGWIVLGRVRPCGRRDARRPASAGQLPIIVPARNEEQDLPPLLRSLVEQSVRPREIIVADDTSTDRAAEVAGEHGARVINSQLLPDGWVSRQIGAFRWWTALLYPVPLVFFFVVFARSARRAGKQVRWKG